MLDIEPNTKWSLTDSNNNSNKPGLIRKRKSAFYQFPQPEAKICNNTSSSTTESSVKDNKPARNLIRRISTRFKAFASNNKVTKLSFESHIHEETDVNNDQPSSMITHPKFPPNSSSSLTYFSTPYMKKFNNPDNRGVQNDRISNSSDTSRHSSSTSQHLRIGIDIFNRNPAAGVDYFKANCLVENDDDLVDLFVRKKGFSKMMLYEYLNNKANSDIHKCFTRHLDLRLKTIPEAIKEYMKYSFITGEYNRMLSIIELLCDAYIYQHPDGGVMGLSRDQLVTIMQFLLTFQANETREKRPSQKLSRERFVDLLQRSLGVQDERQRISRQLASCLYLEVTESPLQPTPDEKLQTLLGIQRQICEIPRQFTLHQQHRYIICHVDLSLVQFPSNTNSHLGSHEKPHLRERTLFLFNDILLITKKQSPHWPTSQQISSGINATSSGSNSSTSKPLSNACYKLKDHLSLTLMSCSLSTRNSTQPIPQPGNMKVVQIQCASTGDVIMTFYSKVDRDLLDFYHTLESALTVHKSVIEGLKKANSSFVTEDFPNDLS